MLQISDSYINCRITLSVSELEVGDKVTLDPHVAPESGKNRIVAWLHVFSVFRVSVKTARPFSSALRERLFLNMISDLALILRTDLKKLQPKLEFILCQTIEKHCLATATDFVSRISGKFKQQI